MRLKLQNPIQLIIMKKTRILLLIILCSTLVSYSQEKFIVTAENGLFLREEPNANGKKIGKLYFGAEVTQIEKTENTQIIVDDGKEISDAWVKITFHNVPVFISNQTCGYVFDGYLKKKTESIEEIMEEISKYSKFQNLSLTT